jgi:lipoprotein-anchoring transpeptidase ErfK/SrfK
MRLVSILLISTSAILLSACGSSMMYGDAYETPDSNGNPAVSNSSNFMSSSGYESRMPSHINTSEKVVVVDPKVHTWAAYDKHGNIVRAGIATAGGEWCNDIDRPCRTKVGTFRIQSLGSEDCYSKIYPKPDGGGLMPYCMFFNGGQALHGSPDNALVEDNVSHGCVRMRIPDAEWMRNDFASRGTKVIV